MRPKHWYIMLFYAILSVTDVNWIEYLESSVSNTWYLVSSTYILSETILH